MRLDPETEPPRHRPHRGGVTSNRMGLQVLRTVGGHVLSTSAKGRPSTPEELALAQRGFAVIADALPEPSAASMRQEILDLRGRYWRSPPEGVRLNTMKYDIHGHDAFAGLLQSQRVLDIARWFLRKPVSSAPNASLWVQSASTATSAAQDFVRSVSASGDVEEWLTRDRQDQWHADLSRPVLKFFYFPFGSTLDQIHLQYLDGSHRLSARKMREEYHSSVLSALERRRLGSPRTVRVCADPERLERYSNTSSFGELEPNTLLAVNTCGYHRRSLRDVGERTMLVLSYKYAVPPLLWK